MKMTHELILERAAARPHLPLFRYRTTQGWETITTGDAVERAARVAAGLAHEGVGRGDRVAILSENRWEWLVVDMALRHLGAVTVGLYPNDHHETWVEILRDSGARAIFLSLGQAERGRIAVQEAGIASAFAFDCGDLGSGVRGWGDLFSREPVPPAACDPNAIATLVYTSGTTGKPKGAILTNNNVATNAQAALERYDIKEAEVYLSFLPLCHAFERTITNCMLRGGACICFGRGMAGVVADLSELQPDLMITVPHLLARVHAKAMANVNEGGRLRQSLVDAVLAVSRRLGPGRLRGRVRHRVGRLVLRKLHETFGPNLRLIVCGGARLEPEVAEFLIAAGLPITEGYGITECSPIVSAASLSTYRPGTVGRPFPGVEVRIATDGEVLVRGPNVMRGYWQDEAATRAAIDPDGWFHTGDLGDVGADGVLSISGRKKEVFVTSGGKNISPVHIETAMLHSPLIAQACAVVADGDSFVAALVVPELEAIAAALAKQGHAMPSREMLAQNPAVRSIVQREIDAANARLANYETVRRFAIVNEEFTQENGLLTPTLKLRRKRIEERYQEVIASLYDPTARCRLPRETGQAATGDDDWQGRRRGAASSSLADAPPTDLVASVVTLPPAQRPGHILSLLPPLLAPILREARPEDFAAATTLARLGVDSILAFEVSARIAGAFGVSLGPESLLSASLAELAATIAAQLPATPVEASTANAPATTAALVAAPAAGRRWAEAPEPSPASAHAVLAHLAAETPTPAQARWLRDTLGELSAGDKEELLCQLLLRSAHDNEPFPLSYAQRGLLFLHALDPCSSAYNIAGAARLPATSRPEEIEAALATAVARHDSLRLVLELDATPLRQSVRKTVPARLAVIDCRGWSASQLEQRLHDFVHAPFDLTGKPVTSAAADAAKPLFRAAILRGCEGTVCARMTAEGLTRQDAMARASAACVEPEHRSRAGCIDGQTVRMIPSQASNGSEDQLLVLVLHHLIGDGRSLSIVLREVVAAARDLSAGRAVALPPAPTSYRAYVQWEELVLRGARGQAAWDYWQKALAGPLPTLDLCTDKPRPSVVTQNGAAISFALEPDKLVRVKSLAQQQSTTPFVTLLAAFAALLQRYTGQSELLIGSPFQGRDLSEFAGTVGNFVNTVVLRARFAAAETFRSLVDQMRQTVLAALQHQCFPFPLLVERLQPARDSSRHPLFQVMFDSLLGIAGSDSAVVREHARHIHQQEGLFDLTMVVGEHADGLFCELRYNSDLFERDTIALMGTHFCALLAAALAAPDEKLRDLPLVDEAQRRRLLIEWNDTAVAFPQEPCLHDLIAAQVARTPAAIAVAQGDRGLTYRELDERATALAALLGQRGVGPGHVVAVCTKRSPAMVVALLGILKAGAAYLPLESSLPRQRLLAVLQDCRPALTVATRTQGRHLPGDTDAVLWLDDAGIAAPPAAAVAATTQGAGSGRARPGDLAYVIYTSGSTGHPKGVMIEHRAIVNRILWMQQALTLTPEDVVLQKTSYAFDVSLWEFFWPLSVGARLLLAEPGGEHDTSDLARTIREHGVTTLHFVPSLLAAFLADPMSTGCHSLRRVIASGEELAVDLVRRSGAVFPSATLFNLYGPTEAAVDVTFWRCGPDDTLRARVPIGRPVANTQIYVLDEQRQPVPIGMPGELYIGGVQVGRGYIHDPELTAARFVPDTIVGEHARPGRLYRTGDRARFRPDGALEFLGRRDGQVKLGGVRIELGDIEAALCRHPGVGAAAAVLHGDTPERRCIAAYVVPASAAPPRPDELRQHLATQLPASMIPARFSFLTELPRTLGGKIDRAALRTAAPLAESPTTLGAPPCSQLEESIAAVWSEVLGLPHVDLDQGFFDAGGHSLLALELQRRLTERLGFEFALVDIFAHPTVRDFAAHMSPRASSRPRGRVRRQAADIAIIGLAGRFPGAETLATFWENLTAGRESVSFFSREELLAAGIPAALVDNPSYVPAAAIIDGAELFDADFFGMSKSQARILDPQQRLFLETAWSALEHAGYCANHHDRPVGVFAGTGFNTYLNPAERRSESGARAYQVLLGNDKDFLATRLAFLLDLTGPCMTVQTACSTGLVAVHQAMQALLAGSCDVALAGAVALRFPQRQGYLFEPGMIFSPDGHCRPFDALAAGMVPGQGAGAVVLKRLDDALADRDTIWAVVKGSAVNNDGAQKVGFTAPSVAGQAAVIEAALAAAGVDSETIGAIEAHGTATAIGDQIEVAALRHVFGKTGRRGEIALGSVKSNIGHLDAAAGIAGLCKTVLALSHGQIPPTVHFTTPGPSLALTETPFFVPRQTLAWPMSGTPRRAGVSSFGIGGTNAHLVLEESPRMSETAAADKTDRQGPELLCLSAKSEWALRELASRFQDYLRVAPPHTIADACATSRVGRSHFARRLAIIGDDDAALLAGITQALDRTPASAPVEPLAPLSPTTPSPAGAPALAFLFSGQGSQYPRMGQALYERFPVYRNALDRCARLAREHLDTGLLDLLSGEARASLDATQYTQPALFALEYSLFELWKSLGVEPRALLGHSLGEYVAACVAGVFTLEEGLYLVCERGRLMGALPGDGTMVALTATEEIVREAIAPWSTEVSLAAINGPLQMVISGTKSAVAAVVAHLAARQVPATPLAVSHAYHSPLMEPILAEFERVASGVSFKRPRLPVITNVTGKPATADDLCTAAYWRHHLRATVQFAQGMQSLHSSGTELFVELGPAPVLTMLGRGCLPQGTGTFLPCLERQSNDTRALLAAVAALYERGAPVAWRRFESATPARVPIPTYPFQGERFTNAGEAAASGVDEAERQQALLRRIDQVRALSDNEVRRRLAELEDGEGKRTR